MYHRLRTLLQPFRRAALRRRATRTLARLARPWVQRGFWVKRPPQPTRHRLAVCAHLQPPQPFLAEWLAFHRLVGIDHFYLYVAGLDAAATALLDAAPDVTAIPWPDGTPASAHLACLDGPGRDVTWLALLTGDDYLFAADGEDLHEILAAASASPVLTVRRTLFGTHGWQPVPGKLLIEASVEETVATGKTSQAAVARLRQKCLIVQTRFRPLRLLARWLAFVATKLSPQAESPRLALHHYLLPVDRHFLARTGAPASLNDCIGNRGPMNFAAQRFVPRLRQALGLPPAPPRPTLQVMPGITPRPAVAFTRPVREFVVLGMQRSGNHAVIQWLLSGLDEPWVYLNNVRPGVVTFRAVPGLTETKGWPFAEVPRLADPAVRAAYPGRLVHSHEDIAARELGAWLAQQPPYLGTAEARATLLILRDPFNLFASRVYRTWMKNWRGFIPVDDQDSALLAERWIEHALEFCGQTRHLPNLVPVNYDAFALDPAYRARLAAQLGITPDEAIMQRTAPWGRGSSFDEFALDGRAHEMDVLGRWRALADHPRYRAVLADARLWVLAEQIFGDVEALFPDVHQLAPSLPEHRAP